MIYNSPALWWGADFRKSSFSGANGGDCVEVAWRESSFSGADRGECVEVARAGGWFGIRDSKNTDGPVLALDEDRGRAFLAALKHDR